MSKKKACFVDGNSLLYRSYYAIRSLSNSKGFPTNAIYGFINTLKKIIEKEKPDYLGIAFDTKGPTFRHEEYKEYKANRKPMPEDLVVQFPCLKKVLSALNIPLFERENYEADDVLGSLAAQSQKKDLLTVIVSTDKDLFQLVDKATFVYNPAKDIIFDEKKVKEFFGVKPDQVIDVLSLWGDQTDNVPGVPGVGEKTAKSLIDDFGSLEDLRQNLDKVKNPRLKKEIKDNLEKLKKSQKLVTIVKDLDIKLDLEECRLSPPDNVKLLPLLQELEFSSLLTEYIQKHDQSKMNYEVILDEKKLKKLIAQIKKEGFVSLDTETDSPYPTQASLIGMSFSLSPGEAYYLPLGHDYKGAPAQIPKERALALLKSILCSPQVRKIGQNIKYDFIVLKKEGLALQGLEHDTMIYSYLLEPNWGKHNLNRLAQTYLKVQPLSFHDIAGKGKNERTLNAVDIQQVTPYACQDADLTLQLSRLLWPMVKKNNLASVYRDLELPLIEVLAQMEIWGIKVDTKALNVLEEKLQDEMQRLKKNIFAVCGEEFNLQSPQQTAYILFEKLGLPSSRRTKVTKGYSTGYEVLKDLARKFPVARDILEHRQLAKLKSGYAEALPKLVQEETGRIHTSYNQTVASTGRLSSSDPNLQNIPVRGELGLEFRKAFIPGSGYTFLSADYAQIELRVLAHLAQDKALMSAFLDDRDIHQETAVQVFGGSSLLEEEQRRRAKIINFSIIYGASAFSLAKELGTSTEEAQNFIALYYTKYPQVKEFLEQCVTSAQKKGYSETLFGRRRQVPELRHQNKTVQQAGRRIALNTPIQGTAADVMKKAMLDIWYEMKQRKVETKMVLQVHDELLFEVPDPEVDEIENLVRTKMEKISSFTVPLKVHMSWGINWADAK